MDIRYILIFTLIGLIVGMLRLHKYIGGVLLTLSALSIFWLQSLSPVRYLGFWLPTSSILLTVLVWAATYPEKKRPVKQILPGLSILLLVIAVVGVSRYCQILCCLGPARPPEFPVVLLTMILLILLSALMFFWKLIWKFFVAFLLITLILLFVILKEANIGQAASAWLRHLFGQSIEMASSSDLIWLGYSFLAFRLIGALRDRQLGRMPVTSLTEFATYALFFPAVISGPIDRLPHFTAELHQASVNQQSRSWQERVSQNTMPGLERILSGVFKKIILADNLAYFALNAQNASQVSEPGWAWLLLVAFSLRIYFDFSGYTDIALGVSRLMGITLPENFNHPYLKPNLTTFWNSWHITLTQWIRGYVFYPLTRALRKPNWSIPTWLIILVGQFVTMVLIGIWHGITWNFFLWGVWHAVGLFIQNRWSSWLPTRINLSQFNVASARFLLATGWLITFIYVSIGWVFFALPNPAMAWSFLLMMFGVAP